MEIDQLYFWCCKICADFGETTFPIDRCRSCDRLISVENITKPIRKSDGIRKPPQKPQRKKIGSDVSG